MLRLLDDALHHGLLARGFVVDAGFAYSLTGRVRGVSVTVREAPHGNNQQLVVTAARPAGSDAGLVVKQAQGLFDGDVIATGSAAFDGVFAVTAAAHEHDAARALVTPTVRAAFTALAVGGYPSLDDDAVRVVTASVPRDPGELDVLVDRCVEAALAADEAALALPPPRPLRVDGLGDAIARFAGARGLGYRANPLTVHGALEDVTVFVRCLAYPREGDARTTLRARFASPLGAGLSVRPAGALDRVREALGLGDARVGDRDFDRAWTIAARDEAALRGALGARARELVTRLGEGSLSFALDDEGLDATHPLPTRAEELPMRLERAASLYPALRGATRAGPYR